MSSISQNHTEIETAATFHFQWQAFARRRALALGLLYGWVPACVALFLLSRYWLHQPVLFLVVMAVWLVGALVSVWWAGEFRCPRCSRRYAAVGRHHVSITRGLFDDICSNCKLTKFERP